MMLLGEWMIKEHVLITLVIFIVAVVTFEHSGTGENEDDLHC